MRNLFAFSFLLLLPPMLIAQEPDFYHPELEWYTVETSHFLVHYHSGAERTGQLVAKIAEEIYDPVTSFYNHTPDQKVSFIIKDVDDISNGAAYFFDNKIEIYAPNLDFELRGTHNWLRDVVTHEFTHIIQIQTSMKLGRRIPSIYFQWFNYESERRPDVLYGFPNVLVSYPLSGFAVPAWFAEGAAQYNRKELRYDFWDTHRDMILRSYALDGNLLGWEEMGVFGKTSLGNESSYNAGFAFVSYIAQLYGEEKLAEISRNLASFGVVSIDQAIEMALGKSGERVYTEWRRALEQDYARRASGVVANLRKGEPLVVDSADVVVDPNQIQVDETMLRPSARTRPNGPVSDPCCRVFSNLGFANLYPAFSPDGAQVAYTSTKGGDYFGLSALYLYDFRGRKEKFVMAGVRTSPAWSPDGRKLYYGKMTRHNPHWSFQYDIYCYSLLEGKETRLTSGRRGDMPSVSPDNTRLVFVVTSDGTSNLASTGIDGSDFHMLTSFRSGEQVYHPHWSPSGDRIVFEYSIRDGRDIASVAPDGSGFSFLVSGPDDSRSPSFSPDGTRLLFSSDRTGIFNLYSLDLTNGTRDQITNVLGGAFYPTQSPGGEILYALYTSGGYKIYALPRPSPMAGDGIAYSMSGSFLPYPYTAEDAVAPGSAPQSDWKALRSYDDSILPALEARAYRPVFTSLMVIPFLRLDNYNTKARGIDLLKPGAYLFSNDVLDQTGMVAGGAVNLKAEADLFAMFFYRGKLPGLYQLGLEPEASAELYYVTRNGTDAALGLGLDTVRTGVGYHLLEFDFALSQPALSQFSDIEFRYAHSRYTSVIDGFVLPATGQYVSASSDLYLVANALTLTARINALVPSKTMEINPVGRRILLRLGYEFNKFAASDSNGYRKYEITESGIQPAYDRFDFPRVELSWREYIPFFFKNHTVTASLRGGSILGPPVDSYFDFYAGGLLGMRGYPFYAIGGNELATVSLGYRFPLLNKIDTRILQLYFDKLYAFMYADLGNAWTGAVPSLKEFKKDAGVQLRLESFSFYAFPTRVFFDAAYGFDRFTRTIPYTGQRVTYGREWRFYFGVLFGFDFD